MSLKKKVVSLALAAAMMISVSAPALATSATICLVKQVFFFLVIHTVPQFHLMTDRF